MTVLTDVFFTVLRMSGYGVAAALLLCCVAALFWRTRVSKTALLALWLVVGFRLVCPWSPPSPLSIFNWAPAEQNAVWTLTQGDGPYVGNAHTAVEATQGNIFDRAVAAGAQPVVDPATGERQVHYYQNSAGNITPAKTFRETYGPVLAVVWLAGVAGFLCYGGVSYFLLKRRLRFAVRDEKLPGVWYSDRIPSPCVAGLIKPQIYLTFGMSQEEKRYVLAHERQHIQNGDHVWKLLAWLLMSVYWFSIRLWVVFYWFFLTMLEQACDQRTLRELGEERKADYGQTLLSLSTGRRFHPGFSPLAFGEGDTRGRVKTVLKYKKPLAWLTAVALAAGLIAGVSVLTGKAEAEESKAIEGAYGTWVISDVIHLTSVSSSTWDYLLEQQRGTEINVSSDLFSISGATSYVARSPVYEPMELEDVLWTQKPTFDAMSVMFQIDLTKYDSVQGWKVLESVGPEEYHDAGWHIFLVDGKLWAGNWVEHPNAAIPYGEYWTIFEAVREGAGLASAAPADNGDPAGGELNDTVVTWEYRPNLSSRLPYFPFSFTFTHVCDALGFHCDNGQLWLPSGPQPGLQGHDYSEAGAPYETIYWSPIGENGLVEYDTLSFTVCQGALADERFGYGTEVGSGSIYIQLVSQENGVYTYTARAAFSDPQHYYFEPSADPELGGASIGGGPDWWPPIQFAATVAAVDPEKETLTVRPEEPLAEGLELFCFDWSYPNVYHEGDRLLVTARGPKPHPLTNAVAVGTFEQVDELVTVGDPLDGLSWWVDLTRDGKMEQVYVSQEGMEYSGVYHLFVENADGKIIWYDSAFTSHVGQNGDYLCYRDGQYYLLNWVPYMSSGTGTYHYKLFYLTPDGAEQVVEQDEITLDMNDVWGADPAALRAFDKRINALLEQSEVLMSTNEDFAVSWTGQAQNDFPWHGSPEHPVRPQHWDSGADYFEELQSRAQGTYTFTGAVVMVQEDRVMVQDTTLWTDAGYGSYVFVIPMEALPERWRPEVQEDRCWLKITADGPLYRWKLPGEGTHVEVTGVMVPSAANPDAGEQNTP